MKSHKSFRLRSISGNLGRKSLFEGYEFDAFNFFRSINFCDSDSNKSDNLFSIVIGKNGTGKSRLLAGIADIFDRLDRGRTKLGKHSFNISNLEFEINGQQRKINIEEMGSSNVIRYMEWDFSLPSKVIAVSATPFEKFSAPRISYRREQYSKQKDNIYRYMGIKDGSYRASRTASIYRAIDNLFSLNKSDRKKIGNLGKIFNFIKFKPVVYITYEIRSSPEIRLANQSEIGKITKFDQIIRDKIFDKLELLKEKNPPLYAEISELVEKHIINNDSGFIFSIEANFSNYDWDNEFFRELQLLRQYDFIKLSKIELRRNNGVIFDLELASSGEISIFTSVLGLASEIEDGSLILIDEPEISLHPDWQLKYVNLLQETFSIYTGCHFIIATHSPLIISEILNHQSNVISLDNKNTDLDFFKAKNIQKSSDSILANIFGTIDDENLFVRNQIMYALQLATEGNVHSEEYKEIVNNLRGMKDNISNENILRIIDGLEFHFDNRV